MSAHCNNDRPSDPEVEQDEAIQRVLDESWAAKGFPRTAWNLRSMLASIGLIIVKSPDSETDPEKRLLELRAQRDAIHLEIERHIDKWVKSIQKGAVP